MRVTKLIREYVIKNVKAKFPKSAEELTWEAEKQRLLNANEEFDKYMEEYALQVVEELNQRYNFAEDYKLQVHTGCSWASANHPYNCDLREKARRAESKRETAISNAIEEILITLEMGGTRADLDAMLAKIGQGE